LMIAIKSGINPGKKPSLEEHDVVIRNKIMTNFFMKF